MPALGTAADADEASLAPSARLLCSLVSNMPGPQPGDWGHVCITLIKIKTEAQGASESNERGALASALLRSLTSSSYQRVYLFLFPLPYCHCSLFPVSWLWSHIRDLEPLAFLKNLS